MLEYVRDGDTLVVTRLDRLARSTLHLCQVAEQLQAKGVNLKVIDQSIDTSDATGRLLFNMLGAIAQFETEIRAERQMDGIRNAKARGVHLGRRKHLSEDEQVELQLRRRGWLAYRDADGGCSLSEASVSRYLRRPHFEETDGTLFHHSALRCRCFVFILLAAMQSRSALLSLGSRQTSLSLGLGKCGEIASSITSSAGSSVCSA